ncbi:MAG: RNA polymerase sigma-70 factor [Bacteroidota bacterium]
MRKLEKIDIEIFEEIKEGNQDAFQFLFDKYYNQLCNFCDYFVKDSSLSEEIVADVFSTIWLKRKKINITVNLKNYLYTSAKNMAFAHLKKKKVYFENIEDFHQNIHCHPEVLQKIDYPELQNKVNKILEKIPPASRKVLMMSRIEGFKYKEIAKDLNISIKTVENHMGTAIRILKENKSLFEKLLVVISISICIFL